MGITITRTIPADGSLVRWHAIRNTERGAIARHGAIWRVVRVAIDGRILIESADRTGLRWIESGQLDS